jgi:hypothetical protein
MSYLASSMPTPRGTIKRFQQNGKCRNGARAKRTSHYFRQPAPQKNIDFVPRFSALMPSLRKIFPCCRSTPRGPADFTDLPKSPFVSLSNCGRPCCIFTPVKLLPGLKVGDERSRASATDSIGITTSKIKLVPPTRTVVRRDLLWPLIVMQSHRSKLFGLLFSPSAMPIGLFRHLLYDTKSTWQ